MSIILFGALIILGLVLQSTIFAAWPLMGVYPDLMLILVVSFSLLNGPSFGIKFGFAAGLGLDLLIGEMIGLNAVIKLLIGFIIGLLSKKLFKENYFVPFTSVFLATIVDQLLYLLGMLLFGLPIPWRIAFSQVIVPLSIYNGLLTLVFYLRFYYLNKKIAFWDEVVKRTG